MKEQRPLGSETFGRIHALQTIHRQIASEQARRQSNCPQSPRPKASGRASALRDRFSGKMISIHDRALLWGNASVAMPPSGTLQFAKGVYAMKVTISDGDLLDQDVDVIVNAWNRNIIPWWLLIPQGVSGAIKRRGGLQPFRELGRLGPIPLGHAVETSAGTLPFKSIIHVAGINMLWRSSEKSIRDSVRNAIIIAGARGWQRCEAFSLKEMRRFRPKGPFDCPAWANGPGRVNMMPAKA
jgi:O-acetyl-ADP-ribose deacetylase